MHEKIRTMLWWQVVEIQHSDTANRNDVLRWAVDVDELLIDEYWVEQLQESTHTKKNMFIWAWINFINQSVRLLVAVKSLSYLQFISNWTEDSIAVALAWFIALHVNLEFKSCLLKRSTTISFRKWRPLGTINVSLNIAYPSRFQVTFGCGLPPKTSHFNFIVSPSLYGPTTVVRSLLDSSRILMRSGGTVSKKIEKNEWEFFFRTRSSPSLSSVSAFHHLSIK